MQICGTVWDILKLMSSRKENILQTQRKVTLKALIQGIIALATSEGLHQGRNNKVDWLHLLIYKDTLEVNIILYHNHLRFPAFTDLH